MNSVFLVSNFNTTTGNINVLPGEHASYEDAQNFIATRPVGYYQIQKVFKVEATEAVGV